MAKKTMSPYKYPFYIMLHPFEGFEELVYRNAFSIKTSIVILVVFLLSAVFKYQYEGFSFNTNDTTSMNIFLMIFYTVFMFLLFCIGNWALCTLLDGLGTFKRIWVVVSYALVPYLICTLICTFSSIVLTVDEGAFINILSWVGILWSVFLLLTGMMAVHEYSFGQAVVAVLLTIVAMAIILFIMLLAVTLFMQVYNIFKSIFYEILYRM